MATEPTPRAFLAALADRGYDHATAVPCSLLSGLFRELESPQSPLAYTPAPREDSALGVASGLAIAGSKPVVLMQNSGLGYGLNVLTSFNLIYEVGLALVISWCGLNSDAIEHDVIGAVLPSLLDLVDIPWAVLDPERPEESAGLTEMLAAQEFESRGRVTASLVSEVAS